MLAYAIPTRFESPDITTVVSLEPAGGIVVQEWERSQDVQGQPESIHGADYAFDPWGGAAPPVMAASERIRALVENEQIDTVLTTLHRVGRGRLWIRLYNDVERWAWVKLAGIPDMSLTVNDMFEVPMALPFTRLSDWYAADATVINETITSSPETVNATNDGLVTTRNVVITLTANSAGGFSNPTIQNTTSNELFTVSRTANSGEQLRIDILNFRAEVSEDGGTTWSDATPSMFLANSQVSPLSLLPEGNVLIVSGVTDAEFSLEYFSAWR